MTLAFAAKADKVSEISGVAAVAFRGAFFIMDGIVAAADMSSPKGGTDGESFETVAEMAN